MLKSLPRISHLAAAGMAFAAALAAPVSAEEPVLNLYSSRHYQTDDALYAGFTKRTGIKINRIEGDENALIERLKNEGRWDDVRFAEVNRSEFQERFAAANAQGLRA